MILNKGEFMSKEKAPEPQIKTFVGLGWNEDAFYNEKAEQEFLLRLFEQGIGHD
jgi:hypothetical protein